ncbi:MAG: OmpA family protein [Thermoanaerobaculia bacterium]
MKRRSTEARTPGSSVARRAPAGSPGPAGAAGRLLGLNQALGNQAMGALLSGQTPGLGAPSLLDPKIPAPKVLRFGSKVLLTIYFGKDHFLLDPRNLHAVEALAGELKHMLEPTVTVDGYASAEGEPGYNKNLSEQRRELVIALLGKDREPRPTFGGTAHGEDQPAVAEAGEGEALEQLRAQNRRVEIVAAPKVFSPLPLPENNKSPLLKSRLTQSEMLKLFPETPEQRFQRRIEEGEFNLPKNKKASLAERTDERLDSFLDETLLNRFGVKKPKRRAWMRELLKRAIKSGVQKLIDKAVDSTDLEPDAKEALKKLIEAGAEVPY